MPRKAIAEPAVGAEDWASDRAAEAEPVGAAESERVGAVDPVAVKAEALAVLVAVVLVAVVRAGDQVVDLAEDLEEAAPAEAVVWVEELVAQAEPAVGPASLENGCRPRRCSRAACWEVCRVCRALQEQRAPADTRLPRMMFGR